MALLFLISPVQGFAQYYPAAPRVAQERLNLLRSRLPQSATAERITILNALSNLYFNKPVRKRQDLALSMNYANKALALSKKNRDEKGRVEALLMLADLYTVLDQLPAAESILRQLPDQARLKLLLNLSYKYWLKDQEQYYPMALDFAGQALVLSKKLHDVPLEIMARKDIAMIHAEQRLPEAEQELLDVVKRYQAIRYPYLHYVYLLLTNYYYGTADPDKALYYSQQSVNSIKNTRDSTAAGDVYIYQAKVCTDNEDYVESINYSHIAMAYYEKHAGMFHLSHPFVLDVISNNYTKMLRFNTALSYLRRTIRNYPPNSATDSLLYLSMVGGSYRGLKQYVRAEPYFKKMYAISSGKHILEMFANLRMGQLYVESRQYAKARPYLYKALSHSKKNLPISDQRHFRYMLFLTDSATNHYLAAIRHQNMFNSLADHNSRLFKDREVKRLQIAFETQKKEAEIRQNSQNIAMLKQRTRAQQDKLRQAQQIRNLTGGGLLLAVIIIALLYHQYQLKQRSSQLVMGKNVVITEKNTLLEQLLTEKEWLLKEVHHRVKNNLHTIFCLLESQAAFLDNDALKAIENSQNRIYAMSLVHQKLYQSDDIKEVNMALYFAEFLLFIADSFDLNARRIRIVQDVEAIKLSIAVAMPMALILNEGLTNAIKYAFEGREKGIIRVSLRQNERIELVIADDGIGMKDVDNLEYNSLGIQLMRGLSADIGATINFEVNNGTIITIKI
ncbi:MAG: sensor histidine kinase [Pedobacter sp.]|uniref:histidine kinase dimerization/phosphoacceptor domain -containing protein n=1 Tax=Pedobacter sp. TaxID=1411316 RepID=UPI003390F298